jgi:hypothetical protein
MTQRAFDKLLVELNELQTFNGFLPAFSEGFDYQHAGFEFTASFKIVPRAH